MTPSSFDTLIFDLGGVLIDWNPEYLYRKLFDDEAAMSHFLTHICTPEWNAEQDAGRPLAVATQLLLDQYPAHETHIRAFYDRWPEMLGGPIAGTVDLLEELRQVGSHRLLALTNWSGETFPIAQARYDFLGYFEGILVSGDEKLKKPDPRIYRLLIDRYAVDPARSIFVDDSAKNVAAASELGIHAIQFHDPAQFRAELEALGVL